jgi:class 3 adenylate cyclase/tetratricopeptide (TPR) repeat protein
VAPKKTRHFSATQKAQIAREAIGGQLSIETLAVKYGISKRRIEEWLQRATVAITAEFHDSSACPRAVGRTPRLVRPNDRRRILDEISRDSEFKEVVVLFADIVGSSRQFAQHDNGQLDYERRKANQDLALGVMIQAIAEFDGTVVQAEGDGVFALFGAPLAQEDYAVNGCRAALRMLDLMRNEPRLAAENVLIRVGLCAGRVMAGGLSSTEKGAFGEPVNRGAHMEKYFSKPGQAWITDSTYRLVEGFFEVEARQVEDSKSALPGATVPRMNIYRLKNAIPSATRFGVRASRKLSAFVGRENELDQLRNAASEVKGGARRRFAIFGSAGIGKSRLVREFSQELISLGWSCAELIGATDLQKTPYAPFMRYLRMWCGAMESADAATFRESLVKKLHEANLGHPETTEALLFAFGLLLNDATMKALEPGTLRNRAHNALLCLMRAIAGDSPLLIVVEDIQWMDAESQAVFDRMACDDGFRQVLIVCTYRSEIDKKVKRRFPYLAKQERIALAGLPDAVERKMLDSLLGRDSGLHPFKAELRSRSKGMPLFVEETVRNLVDTGYLTGEPGNYRLTTDSKNYPRPSTVDLLFAVRVDNLRPRDKSLLQAAAVLGRTCSEGALAHLAEISVVELRSSLLRLARAGLISSIRQPDGAWHSFNHALCQEVVYEGLMPSRKVKLHRRALSYLKMQFRDSKQEVVELLAHHAVGSEQWEEAIHYLQLACEAAQTRWANREAVRFFDIGVEVLKKLKDGPNKLLEGLTLKLTVIRALRPLGELGRVRKLLPEAERVVESLNEEHRIPVYLQRSLHDWVDGHHRHGLLAAEKVLAFPGLKLSQRVHAGFCRGMALHALGRFADAISVLREVRSDLSGPLRGKRLGWPGDPVLFCDAFLGSALTLTGEIAEARQLLDAASALALNGKHPSPIAIINDVLAEHHLTTGNPAAAEPLLLHTIQVCQEHELFEMYPPALAHLALAETRCGKWRMAQERLRIAAAERLYTMGGTYAVGYMLHAEAETNAAAGRTQKAMEVAKSAEARHRTTGARAAMAQILVFQASLLKNLGRVRSARTTAEQARAIARECGMRPLVSSCDQLLREVTSIHTRGTHSKSAATGGKGERDVRQNL